MTVIDTAFDPIAQLDPENWIWPSDQTAESCWAAWACATASWLRASKISPSDALVIVPVGAVLSHARRGWADAVGGWAPRIETVASLIASHGWRWDGAGQVVKDSLTLDPVSDALIASQKLSKEPWCRQWIARDRRGFDFAVEQLVSVAHMWVRRAQAIAPKDRRAYWNKLDQLLANKTGNTDQYGARERLLLVWALAWVMASAEPGWPSDVLFELEWPCLIGISAGTSVSPGTEAHLMLGMMAHAKQQNRPARWLAAHGQHVSEAEVPGLVACADAEDEARHAATFVLQGVQASRRSLGEPVALIALDRSLIRRVRAMLDGTGCLIADETGWHLSTTRASTVITRLITASHPLASTDDLLDWIKSGWLQLPQLSASGELESWYRKHGWLRAWDEPVALAGPTQCPDGARALWQQCSELIQPLRTLRSSKGRTLRAWLDATAQTLKAAGAWEALVKDEAGELVLDVLQLEVSTDTAEPTWTRLLDEVQLDGAGFARWVGEVLENTTFRPAAPLGRTDVVITPMARAVMRPFHGIVLPGADARQLGGVSVTTNWLGPALTEQMLLATPQAQRQAQWEAFGLLMARPGVVCLHRQGKGSEPVEASPWLARWEREHGVSLSTPQPPWRQQHLAVSLNNRPTPRLESHSLKQLPTTLSATSYEVLRQCPYRFYAQSILKLREADELEEGLDRSDFGTWLHEVIRRFHVEREQQLAIQTPDEDLQAWLRMAQAVMKDLGFDSDCMAPFFLPYRAVLPEMARAYVEWLHDHEQDGWRCVDNESSRLRTLPMDDGSLATLKGQIDRIDTRHREGQSGRLVIDYKTGSLPSLKERVKRPLEDTQLPFYAALMDAKVTDAAYLHLDAKGATLVRHDNIQHDAALFVDGLLRDLDRIKRGQAMPALGEGAVCSYCQVRGLCRKDHWPQVRAEAST